jgi:hypothetical protein
MNRRLTFGRVPFRLIFRDEILDILEQVLLDICGQDDGFP